MTRDRLKVLIYLRDAQERHLELLRAAVSGVHLRACRTVEEVRREIPDTDVLLASIAFPGPLLHDARRLRWIQVTGAGVDAFLADASIPPGVILTRAVLSYGDQIAEYVLGHLLALTQKIRDLRNAQQARHWEPMHLTWLKGKTLGIVGPGTIGQAVARCARCFGMEIHGLVRTPRAIPSVDRVFVADDLRTFLHTPHVVVIAAPLTDETRGLFDRAAFASMRNDAVLVNVARGPIVDEAALVDALQTGEIAGAILDVFATEPLPPESPLWTTKNVVITPHHAGLNVPEEMVSFFVENLSRFRRGAPLLGVVDLERRY